MVTPFRKDALPPSSVSGSDGGSGLLSNVVVHLQGQVALQTKILHNLSIPVGVLYFILFQP